MNSGEKEAVWQWRVEEKRKPVSNFESRTFRKKEKIYPHDREMQQYTRGIQLPSFTNEAA
jgi:soluble cytochrome b562